MATFHLQALADAMESFLQIATIPSGTVKLHYMAPAYTPDPDNSYWSDISANEASGAPTVTLSNVAVNIDTANNRVEIDFDDPSSSTITTTTDQFVIVLDTGVDSTSPILFSGSISTELNPVAGTLSLTIDANGACALNAAAT